MNKLNSQQQKAVQFIDTPLLVLAGAGSGKTSVITAKIAYLIEQCGIKPHNIAAVTFTNKAAKEMKERVSKLLVKKPRGLMVSTFHTFGLNILRKEYKSLNLSPGFSIFDEYDARQLLSELMRKDKDIADEQVRIIQSLISQWKNDLLTPEQMIVREKESDKPLESLAVRIYEAYERHLRAYNAVDFDDLILRPVELFRNNPDVLAKWQRKIHYLLVDEYQDTNGGQYHLVKLLVGSRHALTVVGDDDQSIYAWRGARVENINQLSNDYPKIKIIKLEQNYRSSSNILATANSLIANNQHEYNKALWSEMGPGDLIKINKCRNEDDEAERVASDILLQRIQKALKFKDCAILYRSNHQSRILEIKLQSFKIPYNVSGGLSFFSRSEVKDILSYLKVIVNPDDDNSFLRIINVPRREIGPQTIEKLANFSRESGMSLSTSCQSLALRSFLPDKTVEKLHRFGFWLENIREKCAQENPMEIIREMIEDIDYEQWLHNQSSSSDMAERRMNNVYSLLDGLQKTIDRRLEQEGDDIPDNDVSVADAVARLVLQDLLERQEKEEDTDQVQLMTLHAAKGLEFPLVYIMGMEEGILPHRNSIDTDDIEEERRLAYVGITRAERQLILSYAAKRKQYGEIQETTPSRFLDELPEECIDWQGRTPLTEEEQQQTSQQALASLRMIIDT